MHIPTARKSDLTIRHESSWPVIYAHIERDVRAVIEGISRPPFIGDRDLTKQLLLHLPRFSADALKDAAVIRCEAERLAARIESKRRGYEFWWNRPQIESLVRKDVVLRECDPQVARVIHERFHYIGDYHEGIVHLGLFARDEEEVPMALASLAPMDIRRIEPLFPSREDRRALLVLSRVFAFDWAPRNTISHLLAKVANWIKKNIIEVRSLLTFLNPNLGFSGTAFKASNWKSFLEIEPISSFVDDDYVSYRALLSLPEHMRKNARQCLHDLAPLKLLKYDAIGPRKTLEYSHSIDA